MKYNEKRIERRYTSIMTKLSNQIDMIIMNSVASAIGEVGNSGLEEISAYILRENKKLRNILENTRKTIQG
ncbi:MAG: hypothetical protein ACYDDC_09135 [Thermoplasmataceae archaeon]